MRRRFAAVLACLSAATMSAPPTASARAWSWNTAHARVDPKGDLHWQPAPFVFEAGASVRYIDFEGGDDGNPGTEALPWKHHPWDPEARAGAAACQGIHTYVLKRGVVYRGSMVIDESGAPGDPIRLTSDPSWGTGEAVICGAAVVRRWTRGADHEDIPQPEKVWCSDLDFAPRNVWMVTGDGEARRIPLARTPNWTVSDPDDVKSEWWHWNYPTGKPFDVFTQSSRGSKLHLGIDTEHLTESEDFYRDAIVWTEYGWVQATPYPARVEVVDTVQHGLGFGGQWGGVSSYKIVKWNRYYLEDKPHYLDDPSGEFWFAKKGAGGRLYLRLPGERDPNSVRIEAGRIETLIDSVGMSHVHISGLTFRFTNPYWDLTVSPLGRNFTPRPEVDPACIRLLGGGTDLRVSHCRFEHVHFPIRFRAVTKGEDIDQVVVSDNQISHTDHGGIHIADGAMWGHVEQRTGLLYDVKVLRNKLYRIGMRPTRYGMGVAIDVFNAQTAELAGNILSRCWGLGINMNGAKRGDCVRDVPLSRVIAHHNKVVDPLLNNNDFGGIETWQGGPFYVYNNIVRNPGGYRHCNFMLGPDKPGSARFGHAYYLDGAFKNYHFNNIAWGKSSDPFSRLGNTAAFQEIHSYQNTFFNNTIYNFVKGTRRQAPQAGRDKFLGNVWQSVGDWVFWHTNPAKTPEDGNEADAGPKKSHYALETNAYTRNVFHDITGKYGSFEPSGRWHESLDALQQALKQKAALGGDVGQVAPRSPLRDPGEGDFRPAPESPVVDTGVKVFVPWALYATVGEWSFYHAGNDPTRILDEHWSMPSYYYTRGDYHNKPMFPLTGVGVTAVDYVDGPLEDWVKGALRFNGSDQFAVCRDGALNQSFEYTIKFRWDRQGEKETRKVEGQGLWSPEVHDSNFLVEVYFRTEPGSGGGVVVEKMGEAGYALALDADGRVAFAVKGSAGAADVSGKTRVNDGAWHHVLAEADRQARSLTIYVDGRRDATGSGVGPDVSLANDADLYVAGTPDGRCLAGTFEFLRICLGTLADAKTTIEELVAWQFDGPFLRDFTGRSPTGLRRDAGAIESTE